MPKVKLTVVESRGGELDQGDTRAKRFSAKCPDEGRVTVRAEVIDD